MNLEYSDQTIKFTFESVQHVSVQIKIPKSHSIWNIQV